LTFTEQESKLYKAREDVAKLRELFERIYETKCYSNEDYKRFQQLRVSLIDRGYKIKHIHRLVIEVER